MNALSIRSSRVLIGTAALAVALGGAAIVRPTTGALGGASTSFITYSGTLGGVAAGTYGFTFTFHKNSQSCQIPAVSVTVDASGAFDAKIDTSQAPMQGTGSVCATFAFPLFDGRDVTVDVAVGAPANVSISGQAITAVPYAKYGDVAANAIALGGVDSSQFSRTFGRGTTAINITSSTDWSAGLPATTDVSTFNVSAGATLTVPSGTVIRATGNVTIAGTIVVNPSGQGADTDSTYSLGVPAIVVLGSQGISTSTR